MLGLARAVQGAGASVTIHGLVEDQASEQKGDYEGISTERFSIRNLYWPWSESRPRNLVASTAWQLIDIWSAPHRPTVASIFDKQNPDVIVTHNLRGWSMAPWKEAHRRDVPIVHVIHDYGLLCFKSTMFRPPSNCEEICRQCRPRIATSRSQPTPSLVVGVSQAVIDEHARHGMFDSVEKMVMHPSVAPSARHESHDRDIDFAFLGRIGVEKGLLTLADAANVLESSVVVAGPGTEREIRELSARSEYLQFVGEVESESFLRRVKSLVVPSLWREPFGRVVLEAARAGADVVVADQPGLIEAANSGGGNWRSFRAGDAVDLADAMCSGSRGNTPRGVEIESFSREAVARRITQIARG